MHKILRINNCDVDRAALIASNVHLALHRSVKLVRSPWLLMAVEIEPADGEPFNKAELAIIRGMGYDAVLEYPGVEASDQESQDIMHNL